jgi:ribosomal protein S18 acetylase RimI-like enzyme
MEAGALTLREATPLDAEGIYEVTNAAYEEYRGVLEPPSGVDREALESVQGLLREGGSILALMDGTAVGAVRYERRDDGSLYVGRLAVLPSHRRRGIGRALMAAAEERARRMGLACITLGVRIQLPQNRAFYESLGYRADGRGSHAGHDRPTWFHMTKTLET